MVSLREEYISPARAGLRGMDGRVGQRPAHLFFSFLVTHCPNVHRATAEPLGGKAHGQGPGPWVPRCAVAGADTVRGGGARGRRAREPRLAISHHRDRVKMVLAFGGGRERKGGRGGRVTFVASRVAVGGVRDHGAGGRRGCQLQAGAVRVDRMTNKGFSLR